MFGIKGLYLNDKSRNELLMKFMYMRLDNLDCELVDHN